MMEDERTCKQCRFFFAFTMLKGGAIQPTGEGECRRHFPSTELRAPAAVTADGAQTFTGVGVHPSTQAAAWCGEFEAQRVPSVPMNEGAITEACPFFGGGQVWCPTCSTAHHFEAIIPFKEKRNVCARGAIHRTAEEAQACIRTGKHGMPPLRSEDARYARKQWFTCGGGRLHPSQSGAENCKRSACKGEPERRSEVLRALRILVDNGSLTVNVKRIGLLASCRAGAIHRSRAEADGCKTSRADHVGYSFVHE